MSLDKILPTWLSTALGVLISSIVVFLFIQKNSIAGPFAYVSGGSGDVGIFDYAAVYKIDLTNGYKSTIIPLDAMPNGIAVHRNGNRAFVTSDHQNKLDGNNQKDGIGTIVVLDTISGKQVHKITTGKSPFAISINYERKEFYVGAENVLISYDLLTYAKKKEYLVKGTPVRILFEKFQRFAFFYTADAISYVLDMESGSLVELAIIDPKLFIWDIVVDRQGKRFFFSLLEDGKVYTGNIENMQVDMIINIGRSAAYSNIAESTNSDEVFVSRWSNPIGEIVVLDSNSGAIIRRFDIPGSTTNSTSNLTTNIKTSEYFPDDLFVITDTNFVVLDKVSGTVKHSERVNNNGACCIGHAQVPPTIGNFVPNAPKDQIDSDRLFNWAEDKYPKIFSSPQRSFSDTADGYYFRYYPGTDTYLGTKGGNVFYLPAGVAMNEIINLGPIDKFLPDADTDGY